MVSAASEVFNYTKKNPNAIHEEVFQHVSDYISEGTKTKDLKIKLAMIAAAGKAFEMAKNNRGLTEKELLKLFMEQIPYILETISE